MNQGPTANMQPIGDPASANSIGYAPHLVHHSHGMASPSPSSSSSHSAASSPTGAVSAAVSGSSGSSSSHAFHANPRKRPLEHDHIMGTDYVDEDGGLSPCDPQIVPGGPSAKRVRPNSASDSDQTPPTTLESVPPPPVARSATSVAALLGENISPVVRAVPLNYNASSSCSEGKGKQIMAPPTARALVGVPSSSSPSAQFPLSGGGGAGTPHGYGGPSGSSSPVYKTVHNSPPTHTDNYAARYAHGNSGLGLTGSQHPHQHDHHHQQQRQYMSYGTRQVQRTVPVIADIPAVACAHAGCEFSSSSPSLLGIHELDITPHISHIATTADNCTRCKELTVVNLWRDLDVIALRGKGFRLRTLEDGRKVAAMLGVQPHQFVHMGDSRFIAGAQASKPTTELCVYSSKPKVSEPSRDTTQLVPGSVDSYDYATAEAEAHRSLMSVAASAASPAVPTPPKLNKRGLPHRAATLNRHSFAYDSYDEDEDGEGSDESDAVVASRSPRRAAPSTKRTPKKKKSKARAPASKRKTGSRRSGGASLKCGHTGCAYSCKRSPGHLGRHEATIGVHYDHIKECVDGCPRCASLIAKGTWTDLELKPDDKRVQQYEDAKAEKRIVQISPLRFVMYPIGKPGDRNRCAHDGCIYTCTPGQYYDVRKHEATLKPHAQHIMDSFDSCKRCQELVESGAWSKAHVTQARKAAERG